MAIGAIEARAIGSPLRLSAQKLASAAAVLLLHLGVFALLSTLAGPQETSFDYVITQVVVPRPVLRPEPPPEPVAAPAATDIPQRAEIPLPPETTPSPVFPWTIPAPAPQPDLTGIGRALYGCGIENLGALAPDERAKCSAAGLGRPPGERALAKMARFSALENARFERSLMRKQGPVLLPCFTSHALLLNEYQASAAIASMNVSCLIESLTGGLDLDSEANDIYAPWSDEGQ